jgi:uncharacterized pyridoxal phosphate-containing UPF0001 family protein
MEVKQSLPEGVSLVAVSKTHPVEALREAYEAGQRIFGESRPQELKMKAETLPADVEWHMIGYEIRVDELEKTNKKGLLFIHPEEILRDYPIPSAFDKYNPCKL